MTSTRLGRNPFQEKPQRTKKDFTPWDDLRTAKEQIKPVNYAKSSAVLDREDIILKKILKNEVKDLPTRVLIKLYMLYFFSQAILSPRKFFLKG